MEPKEQKENGSGKTGYVRLTCVNTNDVRIEFRVKKTAKFGKLKKAYSDKVGVQLGLLRFLYDGARLGDDQTPKMLEMEEGEQENIIEVHMEATGGGEAF